MSELLEKILDKKNMNEAYKKICANRGAVKQEFGGSFFVWDKIL